MRWMWVDRVVELDKGRRCVAIKNVSLAEEVLHDHFAAGPDGSKQPVLPNTLIIEGMAQTAGVLVGHANDFRERVILAKVGRARFTDCVRPGFTLRFTAELERLDATGASTTGTVELLDSARPDAGPRPLAEIDLMFSHVNAARTGLDLPDHNFVFSGELMDLLKRSGVQMASS